MWELTVSADSFRAQGFAVRLHCKSGVVLPLCQAKAAVNTVVGVEEFMIWIPKSWAAFVGVNQIK